MVERQGWGEIKEGLGAPLRKLLEERAGRLTIVRLASGEELQVFITGWGRDYGDLWEHIYADTDQAPAVRVTHFLYLSEVESLWDPTTGAMLIEQVAAPGQT